MDTPKRPKIVMDTSVLIAALRSESGAAAEVLRRILLLDVILILSYALACEYRDVALRPEQVSASRFTADEIIKLLFQLEDLAHPLPYDQSHRPMSADPNDDLVLEAAINGEASVIVTHNIRHLRDAAVQFKIKVKTPAEFLHSIRWRSSMESVQEENASSAVVVHLDPALRAEMEAHSE